MKIYEAVGRREHRSSYEFHDNEEPRLAGAHTHLGGSRQNASGGASSECGAPASRRQTPHGLLSSPAVGRRRLLRRRPQGGLPLLNSPYLDLLLREPRESRSSEKGKHGERRKEELPSASQRQHPLSPCLFSSRHTVAPLDALVVRKRRRLQAHGSCANLTSLVAVFVSVGRQEAARGGKYFLKSWWHTLPRRDGYLPSEHVHCHFTPWHLRSP
ncbi:hypothetical protein MRX96_054417 [Rhipicephalus microplus]